MKVSLQVLYPTGDGTTFDYDYYLNTHVPLVVEHMGSHIAQTSVSKGVAGGPDTPPAFYAIATMVFENQAALDAAMGASGPVLEDLPNFYGGEPTMLIGEVLA